ncbi:TetR/AcrR family transcriptional regulator [Ensifer adhaerens]|uniref:TetR/AcrR family transcriptional regulator n=1 Tax=Ensifer adhaerens TaxID=106592 RepID=UPI000CF0C059|nr:TetR/AcrR family transcriptional regulator C-terminal domain-containing protein [Ensifer adhaerens]
MAVKRNGGQGKRPPRVEATAQAGRKPGGEPSLSLERIVATAVELLDAEGIEGLKMRQLADRLGAGVMSLYWHVGNKEEVFDLALDAVFAFLDQPQTDDVEDWRKGVVRMLEDWRAIMLRHPWSASLLPRRALGANILGRLETMSEALSRAGVADADMNVAIWSLWNYVLGATVTRASFALSDADQAAGQERLSALSERYPTIERTRLLLDSDWDGTFRKGLDVLLDGLPRG